METVNRITNKLERERKLFDDEIAAKSRIRIFRRKYLIG